MVNLKEYLHPRMDILFLALNAAGKSNNNGHWFSGNRSFWNKLYHADLIKDRIEDKCNGDEIVFGTQDNNYRNWVYGVTDLNRDIVQTSSAKVRIDDEQVKRILDILDRYEVRKLCIMHSKVAIAFQERGFIKRFSGKAPIGYGEVGNCNGVRIFEVPFHNASVRRIVTIYSSLIDGE